MAFDMTDFIEIFKKDKELIKQISNMAEVIWKEHYKGILSDSQIEFMLHFFQSENAIIEQIKEENYRYFLIKSENKPAGYFAIVKKENHIFLSKIYILKEFRKKGLATSALQKIQKISKENNFNRIRLNVNKDNTSSIEAYKKLGFKIVDSIMIYIGSGFILNDFIMEIEF